MAGYCRRATQSPCVVFCAPAPAPASVVGATQSGRGGGIGWVGVVAFLHSAMPGTAHTGGYRDCVTSHIFCYSRVQNNFDAAFLL